MIYLEKNQRNFLIQIFKQGQIMYDNLPSDKLKIAIFLEENKLIDVTYETKINYDYFTQKADYSKGKRISATISESGKAYLSEKKHEFKKLILKDAIIPIIVTLITNALIYGTRLLLPLIQELLSSIP